MAKEIERKFLVIGDSYKQLAIRSHRISQGYLSTALNATVRVRILDDKAYLTVKGCNIGAVRDEWEYPIPVSDAENMLACCCCDNCCIIEKTRYIIPVESSASGNLFWEVDCFHGIHEGLTIAEIELPDADTSFVKADFIGNEVTGDPAYYNSVLSRPIRSEL